MMSSASMWATRSARSASVRPWNGVALDSQAHQSATGMPPSTWRLRAISWCASKWASRVRMVTGSTKPWRNRRTIAAARRSPLSSIARKVQLGALPSRRPVRPMRCKNDDHGGRGVDLEHVVEIADVDAELERAGGDDDAVLAVLERSARRPGARRGTGSSGSRRCRRLAARSFSPSSSTPRRLSTKTSRFLAGVELRRSSRRR